MLWIVVVFLVLFRRMAVWYSEVVYFQVPYLFSVQDLTSYHSVMYTVAQN
jgi:hypothetical protein